MTAKKLMKCPQCCPEVRIDFYAESARNESGEYVKVWHCCNCSYTVPRRTNKTKSEDTTPSQNEVIRRMMDAGYTIRKMSMIGREVWIDAERESDNLFKQVNVYGTIGVRGAYELKVSRFLMSTVEVTDEVGFKVYVL